MTIKNDLIDIIEKHLERETVHIHYHRESINMVGYMANEIADYFLSAVSDRAETIDVVFDGPPSAVAGRFVECERTDGSSVRAGDWIERPDGMWALRMKVII